MTRSRKKRNKSIRNKSNRNKSIRNKSNRNKSINSYNIMYRLPITEEAVNIKKVPSNGNASSKK